MKNLVSETKINFHELLHSEGRTRCVCVCDLWGEQGVCVCVTCVCVCV